MCVRVSEAATVHYDVFEFASNFGASWSIFRTTVSIFVEKIPGKIALIAQPPRRFLFTNKLCELKATDEFEEMQQKKSLPKFQF